MIHFGGRGTGGGGRWRGAIEIKSDVWRARNMPSDAIRINRPVIDDRWPAIANIGNTPVRIKRSLLLRLVLDFVRCLFVCFFFANQSSPFPDPSVFFPRRNSLVCSLAEKKIQVRFRSADLLEL